MFRFLMQHLSIISAPVRRGAGRGLVLLAGLLAAPLAAQAQTSSVGIGTTAPDASAALDIVSSNKGALLPRVADATAIAQPATGLIVYQTGGTAGFYYNAGTPVAPSWQQLATASGAAVTAGNGLTMTGNTVALGGALTQPTTLAAGANPFALTQTGPGLGAIAPDQSSRNSPGTGALNGANYQTVTAGVAGALTQIELSLGACTNNSFTLTVYNGAGTGGTVLYTGTVVCQGSFYGFRAYPVTGVTLAAGQVFTIGVSGSAPNWVYNASDVYAGGQAGFNATADFLFSTTMQSLTTTLNALTLKDGNVGIGTTTPAQKLDVAGNANVSGSVNVGGNVGIGTTTPTQRLDVAGNANVSGYATVGGDVNVGGNVGIGTTTPAQKLDVAGGIRFTGAGNALTFPDGTTQTTAATAPPAITASNGLTQAGNNIALGGTLTRATTLANGGYALSVTGTGPTSFGASVGVGTTTPDASALLDLTSTTQGLLPPRLTKAQRDAIASPALGLTIFNTLTNKLNTWNGTSWDESLSATQQTTQLASQTFAYTGGPQTYTVPTGVYSLTVDAAGASGGNNTGATATAGGGGGRVRATLAVTPGEVLTLYVGGAGSQAPTNGTGGGGYNGGGNSMYSSGNRGGGGGGATDLRRGGAGLSNRVLVAAGGGGGGYYGNGGDGGGLSGGNGTSTDPRGTAGTGGTQTAGGSVGGTLGQGGNAYSSSGFTSSIGGGGGGYYGGGGGSTNCGGGGGSSWVTPTGSSAVTLTSGYQAGNGSITLSPAPAYAAPVLDGSNFVNVPGTWQVSGADVYRATGSVGIGTPTPDLSAALDVRSTSKGLLPPRLSLAQRDAIASPAPGLTLFNTSTGRLNTWNGTSWDESLSATQQTTQLASQTFAYTGGPQTYTVPTGVYSLAVDAAGASGGNSTGGSTTVGGGGARAQATLAVTPGEVLTLYVGGAGSTAAPASGGGGYNGGGSGNYDNVNNRGGGGGGATDLRRGGAALSNRVLVAAGGGGSGYAGNGGAGGAPTGAGGGGTSAGTGATQSAGGSSSGALGQGGGASPGYPNGGGGGGYYGGGGSTGYGAGGGGSSWVAPTGSSAVTFTSGYRSGNGIIVLTPGPQYAAPVLDGSNFVNVPGDNLGNHTATQNLDLAGNQLVSGGGSGISISSGLVGIGTTTPGQKLDVAGNTNVTGNSYVGGQVGIGTTSPVTTLDVRTADGSAAITVGQTDNTAGAVYFGNPSHGVKRNYSNGNDVGLYTTAANLYLSANGTSTSQFVLLNSGNVGIGTTPGAKLHVAGGVKIDGTNTLEFGAGVAGKEASAGKIGYRTFSADALDIVGAGTGSNRVIRFYAENGASFNGVVNATGFGNSSDARFKQHVRPLGGALSSVLALRGVRYEWNALGVQHGGKAGAGQVGLIAQELEKVYPELVFTDAQGYKSVNYAQLTPVLLEALKEQQAQLEALKAEAAAAKAAAAQATAEAAGAKAQAANATATLETFEARLRRLEAATGGQAQR